MLDAMILEDLAIQDHIQATTDDFACIVDIMMLISVFLFLGIQFYATLLIGESIRHCSSPFFVRQNKKGTPAASPSS